MSNTVVVGSRVLITGAAKGLGRLFAERAVADGAAAVVLWDIDEAGLQETAAALEGSGARLFTAVVDLFSREAIAAAAARVRDDLGGIDILVNNAGVVRGNQYFWEPADSEDITTTIAVNSLAPMYLTREFLPGMVAGHRPARLLNIASMAGFLTAARTSVYTASKWAAVGWSDTVRMDLETAGHRHVKVTTVCPGFIDTGMFDGVSSVALTPILDPADVVSESWRAMRSGAPFVVMPFMAKVGRLASAVLPIWLRDFVLGRLGLHHSMASFHGRN